MARTARRQLEGRHLLFEEYLRGWTNLNVHYPLRSVTKVWMTDTSARGRIEFYNLWCLDCVSLIRSRFHVILKFSFHHSSTKFPFNRVSNQNWFLGHDHARLTRLVLRRATCTRINRFRLDLFRCCKSTSCCNLDSWVC